MRDAISDLRCPDHDPVIVDVIRRAKATERTQVRHDVVAVQKSMNRFELARFAFEVGKADDLV